MATYYTYSLPQLLDSSLNNTVVNNASTVYGNVINNTGNPPYTNADAFCRVYSQPTGSTASAYIIINHSPDGIEWDNDTAAFVLDMFTFNNDSSNPLRLSFKDVKLLPYYLKFGAKNPLDVSYVITMKVYGRTYLLVNA